MSVYIVMTVGVAVFGYVLLRAFFIEPTALHVTQHIVSVPSRGSQHPFHFVQLSDLHLWGYSDYEKNVIRLVREQSPDAIMLTGDYAESEAGFQALATMLSRLRRIAPVYAVLGDNDMEHAERLQSMCRKYGIRLLRNAACIHWQGSIPIVIAGVDDPNTHYSKPAEVKRQAESFVRKYTTLRDITAVPVVLLAHSPEISLEAASWMDIIITGHTHGGQICLPGGYALYTNTPACRGYASGWYELQSGSRMYVHRGVGTARIPARLFCRPEIASFSVSVGTFPGLRIDQLEREG